MTTDFSYPVIADGRVLKEKLSHNPVFGSFGNGRFTGICYAYQYDNLFSGEDARWAREGRGLIYDSETGEVLSRPFQKFANAGQWKENSLEHLRTRRIRNIWEKMDGSMVRPVRIPGEGDIHWMTKKGFSDVAVATQKDFTPEPYWSRSKTRIFEYVSPENRIVIGYDKPEIVLLAERDNLTGEYTKDIVSLADSLGVRTPARLEGFSGSFDDLMRHAKELKGLEGYVVEFEDGTRVKLKGDEYLGYHEFVNGIRFDHQVVKLILEERIDDVLPKLDSGSVERVERVSEEFYQAFDLMKTVWASADPGEHTGRTLGKWLKENQIHPEEQFAYWAKLNQKPYDAWEHFVNRMKLSYTSGRPAFERFREWVGHYKK